MLGYTQHAQLPLVQVAAVTGVYGVSFILALGNMLLAEVIHGLAAPQRRVGWGPSPEARTLSPRAWPPLVDE